MLTDIDLTLHANTCVDRGTFLARAAALDGRAALAPVLRADSSSVFDSLFSAAAAPPTRPIFIRGILTTPGALCTTDPDHPDLFTHYLLDDEGVLRFKEGHRHLANAWCHLDTSYFRQGDWAWDGASDASQLAHEMPDIGAEDIYFHCSDTFNNAR